MQRPRIKRTTEPIGSPDGDVYLLRPSAGPRHPDRAAGRGATGGCWRRSTASTRWSELHEEFGAEAVDDADLPAAGAGGDRGRRRRRPASTPPSCARFDRQLRYFSDIGGGGLTPSECQRRLREAKVAVLGVGGLGGWAAWSLACCGIGEMWLIDGDRVELSNLNRQILYTEADIGLLKVEVAAARLRAFNPAMRVTATARRLESEAEIADFIAGADVVIDAADWPAHDIERWCNAACFEAGIPYITMSHFPPIARVGPLYVPGATGCYACQETAYRREYPLFDVAIERAGRNRAPAATLGPACGLIGGQVGMEVMHLLTGLAEPSTLGVAHIYDLRTMEVEREPVVPEPDCPVCGHLHHAATAVKETAGG